MISFVEGDLVEKHPTRVVVNIGGLGYEVFIPISTYDRLPAQHERCRLLTHDYVREDTHALYGFSMDDERRTFEMLLGINGIGPRIAMSALSSLSVRELRASIVEGDIKRLSSVSGIGKKMAERIVVELKDKLSAGEALAAVAGVDDKQAGGAHLRDAVLALISLGYKQADALKMVRNAASKLEDTANVEELIRRALIG